MALTSLDLYLIPQDGREVDTQAVRKAIDAIPQINPARDDPALLVYRDEDTTVHFTLMLGDEFLRHEHDDEDLGLLSTAIPEHADAFSESSVGVQRSRSDEEDWEEEDDDGDEDDEEYDDEHEYEEGEHTEMAPVTLSVPCFRPTFFITDALIVAEDLSRDTGLQIALVEPSESETSKSESAESDSSESKTTQAVSNADVLDAWYDVHRRMYEELQNKDHIQIWSLEECAHFYDYNRGLATLRAELAAEGIEVPRIQPALHEGQRKTLCVWRSDQSSVLPATDLVLVQHVRKKRGLFGRTRTEERVVPSSLLWGILERFGERRDQPSSLLVVRRSTADSTRLETDLDGLVGESVENARRTELIGVVDFDPTK